MALTRSAFNDTLSPTIIMKGYWILLWLSFAVLCASHPTLTVAQSVTNEISPVWVARAAPRFELSDLYGRTVKLAGCTSTAVVVSFVLANDGPSQRQLEELMRARAIHTRDDLTVFAIVMDNRPDEALRDQFEPMKTAIQFLRHDLAVIEGFGGITAAPTTFVLDYYRNIISRHVGFVPFEQLEPKLRAIIRP